MELQKTTGYLKNAYYQGHGRYLNQIIRMTLKLCKSSGGSREARKFVETRLVETAKANPGCVIYVKPRLFKSPVLTTEYVNGQNHHFSLYRLSCEQIETWMKWYLTRSGYDLHRLHDNKASSVPSVQGTWTPFYFKNSPSSSSERVSATKTIESLAERIQCANQA